MHGTKGKTATIRSHTELLEHRNTQSKDLAELRQAQQIYMPGLGPLPDGDESSDQLIKLWLPSDLTQDNDRTEQCLPGIPGLELRFRYAQADDSLGNIRRLRRLLQGLMDQNTKHLNQTQQNITRTKGIFTRLQSRISRAVERYRHARQMMLVLDPLQQLSPGWTRRFQELEDKHVKGPGREHYETSEGTFQPSWIWLVPRLTGHVPNESTTVTPAPDSHLADPIPNATEDLETAHSMRVHWAKCQARADRYEEEVMLAVEEMGRTLSYFQWKKSQWLSLRPIQEQSAPPSPTTPAAITPLTTTSLTPTPPTPTSSTAIPSAATPPPIEGQRGLNAYACRQAHIYEMLTVSFANRWRGILVPHGLGAGWLHQYPVAADPLSARPTRGHSQPMVQPDPALLVGNAPVLATPPLHPELETDQPIESDTESDNDADYNFDGEESDFD